MCSEPDVLYAVTILIAHFPLRIQWKNNYIPAPQARHQTLPSYSDLVKDLAMLDYVRHWPFFWYSMYG